MRSLLWCALLFAWATAASADVGVVTIADPSARVLRGATWYRLAPGVRVDDGDILRATDRGQVQIEFSAGPTVSVTGPSSLHVVRGGAAAPLVVTIDGGWAKAIAKPPGLRIGIGAIDVVADAAVVVVRADASPALFVESGGARLVELNGAGTQVATRDVRQGEHASRASDGRYSVAIGATKAFVDAMPKPYTDALPALAAKHKTPVEAVADHDVTYAEAEPWLAGRDRAAFEKRFVVRLRDPAFRRAVEPHVARYPTWDRMLHPEKFAPKQPPEAAAR